MAYTVPDLPYPYEALEPHIDAETMRIHHDKHHQAYVDNANKALDGTGGADRFVEDILRDLSSRRTSRAPSATTPAGTRTIRSSGR